MHAKHHKILGNEWDAFESNRFFDLPAVFATSFRKPLHRALSQFRFECIEDRGCRIKVIEKWWEHRKDLANVYTWTFTDKHVRKKIQAAMDDASVQTRRDILGQALDTVAKFHLVMVMEWLAYAPDHVRKVLGFEDTHPLTERVRPHINQYQRDDGQETNKLGAAGIAKASWSPEEYLSKEQYKIMSEDLALDEILTDAARRMFLERVVCREDQ
uniref:Sulfotransferase domain-containing protein n=1 Tax=Craspedostauros australis TaxID=1486917 RepID=A0A7R9WU47_9STRA